MNKWLVKNKSIFKYAIVGILGTATHIGILTILVECFSLNPLLGSTLGFLVTLVESYLLNYYWTFKAKTNHAQAISRYFAVSVFGLLLNTLIMYLAIDYFRIWYLYGQILVIFCVPLSNYFLNKIWTFRHIE